ncbi:cytochrome P460 family protein [Xanthomonas arboricola]|uniref:cytochrome P460 family protein n=1 Tax=Xanthomonas arboricola TaxID=56448 RepID=UPI00141B2EB9
MKKERCWLCVTSIAGAVSLLAAWLVLPATLTPGTAEAQASSVSFPLLEQLVHYTTVERGETLEKMLTSKAAIETLQSGKDVPVGTQFVLVDHRNGKLLRYLVSEKTGQGRDDWQYQSFLPDRSVQHGENPSRCFACHESRNDRQFLFTFSDVRRYNWQPQ